MTENSGIYTPDELFEYFENKFDEVEIEEQHEYGSLCFLFKSGIEYCGVSALNIKFPDGKITVSFVTICFSWFAADSMKDNKDYHLNLFRIFSIINTGDYLGAFSYNNDENLLSYVYKFPAIGIDDDFIDIIFAQMDEDMSSARKKSLFVFE